MIKTVTLAVEKYLKVRYKVQLEHNHTELELRIVANGRSVCLLEPVFTSN